jgi:hypothetical protein
VTARIELDQKWQLDQASSITMISVVHEATIHILQQAAAMAMRRRGYRLREISIRYRDVDPSTGPLATVDINVNPYVATYDHIGGLSRHRSVPQHLLKRLAIYRIGKE